MALGLRGGIGVGEYREVPEEELGREEQPDGSPSLAPWALGWDQGER